MEGLPQAKTMATTQQKHNQEHQLQCERDARRWAAWINSRLRKAIKRGDLAPLEGADFAERLRSGVVLWRLLDTCADDLPQTPRGLRLTRPLSRIECLDNLAFVFKALDRIGVDHTGIGPLDVADARLELVLGLVWSLMAHVASRERDNVFKWAAITHANVAEVPSTIRKIDAAASDALPASNDSRRDLAEALTYAERRFGVAPLFDADEPSVDERCVVAYLAELRRKVIDPSPPPSPIKQREAPWLATLKAWRDRAAASTNGEGRAWAAALHDALDLCDAPPSKAWDALRADADTLSRRSAAEDDSEAAALAAGKAMGAAEGRAEARAAQAVSRAIEGKEAAAARMNVQARAALKAASKADAAAAAVVAEAAARLVDVEAKRRAAFEEGCRTALKDAAATNASTIVDADASMAAATAATARAVETARRDADAHHAAAKRAAIEEQVKRLGERHGHAIRALQEHAEAAIVEAQAAAKTETVIEAQIADLNTSFDPETAFQALSATLEFVRGHAVSLHRRDAGKLIRAVDAAYDRDQRLALVKKAHLKIKEVVVRLTRTEFQREARWTPRPSDDELARLIEPHERALLLSHLRNFVVAFDNMPAAERQTLSTMREVVVNLDWLCALAKLGVASDRRRRSSQGSPRSPPEVSPRRRAEWAATPPRPPMPLALSADER